ncbi:hypothetical protein [Pyxidicoccus xibeiensis]|uniref:hypothetical protein n=1 Tax=Pyxidicoccus xibeiensis TaxID=2906759 RepID=UPI0020A733DC|nr:hypothetical protein [Pyxidicoccus xibeiensis]MCP3141587.1 hypothetical protein [Pyxidicoccus xibeiensis]
MPRQPPRQAVTALLGGRTEWWVNAAVSFSVVVALSAPSWHGVEKPALTLKDRVPALLRRPRLGARAAMQGNEG